MLDKYNADPMLYASLLEYARTNRRNQTEAEKILWDIVKAKGLGFQILRQYIIDSYIVDFICRPSKLIIEVDGGYHSEPQQEESDEMRTKRLQSLGFRVIRFTNEEILFHIEDVIKTIKYNL
jgi:very-short-patch-repair endonuclease